MNRSVCSSTWCAGLTIVVLACVSCWSSFGQAEQPQAAALPVAGEGHRKLAPGVMHSVDPDMHLSETFNRHDVVELLAVDPNFGPAKNVPFRRDVWYLEFKFKPVRMIRVDVPQASGLMRRKLIWYMVYSVTNPGKAMHPVQDADGTYKVETVDKPVRFSPQFLLENPEFKKAYPDRVIPIALGPITSREDPRRKFHTSVSIVQSEIQVGQTVWGIVTWEGIDPRVDRFSIYVTGLTNAYRWTDPPGAYKKGDPIGQGRQLTRKTLKLNFWRPGDEYDEDEKEIRYGIPEEVDYEWVYR